MATVFMDDCPSRAHRVFAFPLSHLISTFLSLSPYTHPCTHICSLMHIRTHSHTHALTHAHAHTHFRSSILTFHSGFAPIGLHCCVYTVAEAPWTSQPLSLLTYFCLLCPWQLSYELSASSHKQRCASERDLFKGCSLHEEQKKQAQHPGCGGHLTLNPRAFRMTSQGSDRRAATLLAQIDFPDQFPKNLAPTIQSMLSLKNLQAGNPFGHTTKQFLLIFCWVSFSPVQQMVLKRPSLLVSPNSAIAKS